MPIAAALIQSLSAVLPKLRRQVSVVRCDHAAFASRHNFIPKKAECRAVTKATDTAAFVLSPMCFRRVFEDKQAMFTRDRNDRVHVGRMTVKVYWNDAFRIFSDFF